jgi:hypothetical protein
MKKNENYSFNFYIFLFAMRNTTHFTQSSFVYAYTFDMRAYIVKYINIIYVKVTKMLACFFTVLLVAFLCIECNTRRKMFFFSFIGTFS